ncbi:MAG: hypothetical protein PF541_05185 [Prolixibacteraceae bacterium]|nr:hypothetical protein [Prolixibacteraceae bacterium]
MENPVWIIKNLEAFGGDIDKFRAYCQKIVDNKRKMKSANNGSGYITCYNYQTKCIEQTDGFLNGGPELRIVRVGQLTEWTKDVGDWSYLVTPSRSDVRYERWIEQGGYWDTEWTSGKEFQVIGIYDEDNTSLKVDLEGPLTGTYKVNENELVVEVPFTTDFSFKYASKEDIIYQHPWGYNWAGSTLCYGNNTICGFVTLKWKNY